MALASLKQSSNAYVSPMENEYGYGTCLSLSAEQCQALGITVAPPAGTVFKVVAMGVAKSVTEKISGEERPEVFLELQLTEMELTPEKSRSRAELAKALYPDME